MFIIKPVSDIKSRVISNNLTEDSAEEYDPTKTYIKGDICKVTATGTVYECVNSTPIISITENTTVPVVGLYPPSYLVSNTGTYPWAELRTINQLAAFDNYVNTQSVSDTGSDFIEYVISIGGCDSFALFNIVAKEVSLEIYGNQGNLISSEIRQTYEPVYTLDDYFFQDVSYKDRIIFTFGAGIGGSAKITIRNTGGTAKCGMIILGRKIVIGSSKEEVELPITDYSKYVVDSIGRVSLSKGLYANLCNFTLYIKENAYKLTFWEIVKILIECRGQCTVWCVDNTDDLSKMNPGLIVCGYYADFSPVFRSHCGYSTIDFKISGVV